MDIAPASLAQIRMGRDGRRVVVDEDVGNVAAQIHEVDPSLGLQWNEKGEFFMVVETIGEAGGYTERLVLTAKECDQRIVERVRQIASPDYDYGAEMDRMDEQAKKDADHRFHEETGEVAEHLAHALRKDLQYQGKVFVPDWIKDA
jgi:hypothetical protein